ncbi:MAG: YdcF family protein [Magnetococcus sp. DMHC-6]
MTPLWNGLVERFIFPPGLILIGLVWIWLLASPSTWQKRRRVVRWMVFGIGVLTYVTSLPVTSRFLIRNLEQANQYPALTQEQIRNTQAQAIVILGHGRYQNAPEYEGDTVNSGGLVRLRYGAWLYRLKNLPILVSGGHPFHEERSEAQLMKRVLEEEFHTPVRWMEDVSRNTFENALFSQKILAKEGIQHILLVTHARDMRRAVWSFQKTGLTVTSASTLFSTDAVSSESAFLDWFPNPEAMSFIGTALHEYLGQLWYWLVNR